MGYFAVDSAGLSVPSIVGNLAGGSYGDLLTAAFVMAVTLAVAFVVHFLMNFYLYRIARKKRTSLDDSMVSALKKPLYVLAVMAGSYLSLAQINALADFMAVINGFYQASAILVSAYTLSQVTSALINWWVGKQPLSSSGAGQFIPVFRKFVTVFIYVIAFVGVLDQLNIKITALLASLGVASLAVALALQDTIANFFAGIYVMADRPVRAGDFVRIENGEEGYVEEVGWRSTKIRTLPNNTVIIPNSKLAQSILTNYYLPDMQTGIILNCGVAYGSDLEKVEAVTVKVAEEVQKRVEGATRGFQPFVRFNGFGDSNINFTVIMRVAEPVAKYVVIHEFMKSLAKAYEKEKIEISVPARKVFLNK
ncbi:MAG TPA: mechanosensitive ion channel family protein [Candidatus Nanoarchaeia archaeon]|nr:mechanosensitive ion channel family protein [Candidatus Nanoarchaeia archaeon]